MSRVIYFSILLFVASNILAQVKGTIFRGCAKKNVEFIEGDSILRNYLIVASGFFFKNEIGSSISELTKKQIRVMQSFSKDVNCCIVFIDFKQTEDSKLIYKNLNCGFDKKLQKANDNGDLIHFYVLSPYKELN